MLGNIVTQLKSRIPESAFSKFLQISQDPDSFVRKHMCKVMEEALNILGPEKVRGKILELAEDEAVLVFAESVPLLCVLSEAVVNHSDRQEVLNVFRGYLKLKSEKFLIVVLKNIGSLLCGLQGVLEESDLEASLMLIENFVSKNESFQQAIAYNFPAVLSVVGCMTEQLFCIFETLSNSSFLEVKLCISKQLTDVSLMAGRALQELHSVVCTLLEDAALHTAIFPQLFKLSGQLHQHSSHLLILSSCLREENSWRKMKLGMQALQQYIPHMSQTVLVNTLSDLIFPCIETQPCPVKHVCIEFLAQSIKLTVSQAGKAEMVSKIVQSVKNHRNSKIRCLFFDFCLAVRAIMSRRSFYKYLVEDMLGLAQEDVLDLRVKFASGFSEYFYTLNPDDKLRAKRLENIKKSYFASGSTTLSDLLNAQCALLTPANWEKHYGKQAQLSEVEKQDWEAAQAQQDATEQDEARRKAMNELTEKYKKRSQSSSKYVKRMTVVPRPSNKSRAKVETERRKTRFDKIIK